MISKRPFLMFLGVLAVLIGTMIIFIHSAKFANIAKRFIARQMPKNSGIEADFREFRIQLFPPGVAVTQPRVHVTAENKLGLPPGSRVSAARMELRFYPLQMFSGKIRVNEVSLVQGEIDIQLPEVQPVRPHSKSGRMELNWRDLVKVRLDAISFEDSTVKLHLAQQAGNLEFNARSLVVRQFLEEEPEFELSAEISDLRADIKGDPRIPAKMDELACDIHINSKETQIRRLRMVDRESGKPLSVEGSGVIIGDLIRPKSLLLTSDLRIIGDLQRLTQIAKLPTQLSGDLQFQGKVRADLLRLPTTLRGEGLVELSDTQLEGWKLGHFTSRFQVAEGLGVPGLALRMETFDLSAPEIERKDGKPASGGRIQAKAFVVPLEQLLGTQAVSFIVPMEFTRTHLHWLVGPEVKAIYPLDLRASGPIDLELVRPAGQKALSVRAHLGLTLTHLQLDNQRLGKTKSLSRVFRVGELKVLGDVEVDSHAVRPLGLRLELPHSKFEVEGKVDFKDGYDLSAKGKIDLDELETLAENKVHGTGDLDVKVHGPTARVLLDFDVNIKDSFYLNMHLGDLRGRITWDDDPSKLFFRNIEAQKGQTHYTGDGVLDLGDKESIDLTFKFGNTGSFGNVQDLAQIFHEMTKDLWWFPQTMTGPFQGGVRVSGQPQLDQLVVVGNLQGNNLEWYREKFRTAALTLTYDKGKYSVDNVRLQKKQGVIAGNVSYAPDETIRWNVKTQNFQLLDLDNFVRLNVPIRGDLTIQSSGDGKIGKVKSSTRMALSEHFVRGILFPPSSINWTSAEGILRVNGSMAGRQALIDGRYDFNPGNSSNLRLILNRFDASPFMTMLNSRLVQDPALAGFLSGVVDLDFKSGKFEFATGKIGLREAVIQKSGSTLSLVREVDLQVKNGSFDHQDFEFRGTLGDVIARLGGHEAHLDGTVSGGVDASILEFFTGEIGKAKGRTDLDFTISGTVKEPVVNGKLGINSVYVKLQSLEQPLENLTGNIQLRKGILTLQYLNGDLATGRVAGAGTVELFIDRFPKLDLKATLSDNKLLVYPFQYVKVRGKLHATGSEMPYRVDGDIFIDSAVSREPVLNQSRERGRRSVRYMPTSTSGDDSGLPLFSLNIRAHGDKGIIVKNDLFDAEVRGDLTLVNTIAAPRIMGWAEVISGKINFKDQGFQIQSARFEFDNPTAINPRFNLTATTEVSSTRIRLYVAGTASDFKLDLTSDPALTEQQIISLLALGFTTEEVNRMKPSDRGAVQQGQAASLLLYSLDFNREVQEKTGIRIQVEEAVDTQSGTSIFRPQTGTESVASPKIVIKRSIGKRVDLSVGSTVGVGTSSQREVNAEVKVTPGVSVIGVWNEYEGVTTQDQFTSYGVDLKLQKRFK